MPAKWGGFDTFVTELTPRLAKAGHDATLFCMPKYTGPEVGKALRGCAHRPPAHHLRQVHRDGGCTSCSAASTP